ncbi:interleukin-6 receptor subunit beta-like [Chiloscyllium punctatum]|uniref:interleukin-6 receptor subunit beta-like n=1 Tax=Chiloscyllium punctatum TaxID=137246 RepID=UPI003B6365C6
MRIINMAVGVCFTKLEIWFLLVPFICAGLQKCVNGSERITYNMLSQSSDTVSVSWENCSYMTLNSTVLHLGDPLSATCQLKSEGCTFDYRTNATSIVWRMNGEEVPGNQYRALNDRMSTVFIPWFNRSKGNLTCHLWYNNSWLLLQWAEVRAGFPPVRPRLSSCISHWTSFLTQSMICNWDSGPETYLETNFTLYISEMIGNCSVRYLDPRNCTTNKTKNSCMVLVSNLASYHDIWVTATNELGSETSSHMCLDGMLIVKFKAPRIIAVKPDTQQNDCLLGQWEMPFEMVTHSKAAFEIQYKPLYEDKWTQVPLTVINSTFFKLCNLLPYTEYQLKIRCKQKTEISPWSEWSNENTGITSECAPAQKLQIWRNIEAFNGNGTRRVHLMWKPLEKSAANGKILGYRIQLHEPGIQVYNTSDLEYSFHLPDGNYKIEVAAYNSVGASPEAQVIIPSSNELEFPPLSHLVASSIGNTSLLIQWRPPKMTTTGYVLEWCVLSEKTACKINWQNVPANNTEAIVQDNIEPMRLYNILLYPLIDGLPGVPTSTQAYSKEGAPQRSPEIRTKQIWKTKVQLEWEELPVDDRNGFIRNYTILYKNKNGKMNSVALNGSIQDYILAGLTANTEYEVNLMVSTNGGSTIGSNLTITTKMFDDGEVEAFLMVTLLFALLTVLTFIAVCIYQRHRLKKHFWPNIPDPANSTLAQWMPKKLTEDVKELKEELSPKTQIQVVHYGSLTKANVDSTNYCWMQEIKHGQYPKPEGNGLNEVNSSTTQSLQVHNSLQNVSGLQEGFQTHYIVLEYNGMNVSEYKKHMIPTLAVAPSDSRPPPFSCLSQIIPCEEQKGLSLFHHFPDNGPGKTPQESNDAINEWELLHGFPFLMNLNIS